MFYSFNMRGSPATLEFHRAIYPISDGSLTTSLRQVSENSAISYFSGVSINSIFNTKNITNTGKIGFIHSLEYYE